MELLEKTLKSIKKTDGLLSEKTQKRLDNLTKPLGSLGRLEELAKQVVEITGNEEPKLINKVIFTLAADHGVTEEGISAYPKEVTPQMVYNFLQGGAGINVLASHAGARVVVADLGVAAVIDNISAQLKCQSKKIGFGTKNMAKGPAMTREEAIRAIEAGIEIVENELKNESIHIIGTGDMGIGNTTASSAIVSVICGARVAEVTGKGTGITDAMLQHKIDIIEKAITINKPNKTDALDVLSKVGGFEIGGLTGVILAGAAHRIPVVIDGFISGAAALLAYTINPLTKEYLVPAHDSVEKGHTIALRYMGLTPVLNLQLRLGEGTGAALVMPIIEAACKVLNEMATFDSAGVSKKK